MHQWFKPNYSQISTPQESSSTWDWLWSNTMTMYFALVLMCHSWQLPYWWGPPGDVTACDNQPAIG